MSHSPSNDRLSLLIASFISQALDLGEDAFEIASELTVLKREPFAGTTAIEIESSVGPAAFLVYHYALDAADKGGRNGAELYDQALDALARALENDTPGPRMIAQATSEGYGLILATTPATFRALTGQDEGGDLEASPSDLLPTGMMVEVRRDAAFGLLTGLREANQRAGTILTGLQAAGRVSEPAAEGDVVGLTEEETALALFLIDERNTRNLLLMMNVLIDAAKTEATKGMP